MGNRKASLRSEMHPYQNSEKMFIFWEQTYGRYIGYAESAKEYFRERAEEFIAGDSNGKKWTWTKKYNT